MADELKIFQAGDKITAEETNDNNRYLLGIAQDTSGELQQYIETQLNQFQNTLNAQISSINTQISAANASINELNNGKLSAEIYASGNAVKFSNGLIIQRGSFSGGTQTFPIPFNYTPHVAVSGEWSWNQVCQFNWVNNTSFNVENSTSSGQGKVKNYIAIGF